METVYSYDNAGNLLTKTTGEKTVTHSYDLLGRLISYTDGETVASYDYYTSNMRRSKTVDGEKTTHIWIGNDIAVDMGANSASYLKGVRLVWSDYGYYLYNSHGDVVQLLGEDSELVQSYDYDAFGIQKGEEPAAPDMNPYRYCGEYTDLESGYNYRRARYYNPTIGRFITADNHWNVGNMLYGDDPIKFGGIYVPLIAAMIQSGNLYVYCGNNPVSRVDDSGDFWNTIIGTIAGAIVGGVSAAIMGTDIGAGIASSAINGFAAGAAVDITIATGGTGLVALAAVSVTGTAGGAASSYVNQRMNGVPRDEIDYGTIAIDAAFGAVGAALTMGTAGVGSSQVETFKQIISKPVKKVVRQAAYDLTTSAIISEFTWITGTRFNHMRGQIVMAD